MHQVIAFIRPSRLADVLRALTKAAHHGVTYSEVRGYGRQKDAESVAHAGAHIGQVFLPKTRLCVAVGDEQVTGCVDAIRKAATTGQIGDGKILVMKAE